MSVAKSRKERKIIQSIQKKSNNLIFNEMKPVNNLIET